MRTIAIVNRKGGVGKSTMSTHIAAGLATLGYRVALVDTDSQGHSSLLLGMPDENGLFKLLIEKQPLENVVRLVPTDRYAPTDHPPLGELFILPSSEKTHQIPHQLEPDESFLFLQRMEEMAEHFNLDVAIVDTAPTMSPLDSSVYLATDGFIYVTECERLSFDGVQTAIEHMERFGKIRRKYLQRDSRIVGIIPNKLRADTRLHRHNVSQLAEAFPGLVWTPITLRVLWAEATNVSELVYTYAPSGVEARDAWKMVENTVRMLESWQTAETN